MSLADKAEQAIGEILDTDGTCPHETWLELTAACEQFRKDERGIQEIPKNS